MLLKRNANPAVAEHRGRTPLHVAAQLNDTQLAATLLENENAPVGAADGKGRTCLHYAAECCSSAVVTNIINLPAGRGRLIVDVQDRFLFSFFLINISSHEHYQLARWPRPPNCRYPGQVHAVSGFFFCIFFGQVHAVSAPHGLTDGGPGDSKAPPQQCRRHQSAGVRTL